jgi:hypothetical protein
MVCLVIVSNSIFYIAPSALLVAAVVAAIPLSGECIGIYQCKSFYSACSPPLLTLICVSAAGGLYGGQAQSQLFVLGLDALGGYVFARMAHNGGQLLSLLYHERFGEVQFLRSSCCTCLLTI